MVQSERYLIFIDKYIFIGKYIMYDYIIDSIIDAYEGDDIWAFEDEVRTTISDCEDTGYSDPYRRETK